ncbi:NIPSNAP family protein [Zhengella mangrovi]|uniref:NIPSNAP family protein n=1 Tax=Zhengella mangrovi TaxID=1982044 RepID=A0A2G1QMY5_9HYPH|nr:NIPSNAP family protein [Zhengella mangrovi]PHP66810.1 NIPSNAP family protein [Zhengella mangrovi]
MIVEQRTYTFHPGAVPVFMKTYEESGARALQQRILGNLIGYFVTETGPLNQTVHLWGYASLDDRAERRAALMREPVWRSFLADILPLLQSQESKVLLPTAFSPLGGEN